MAVMARDEGMDHIVVPEANAREAIETTKIHSVAGLLSDKDG